MSVSSSPPLLLGAVQAFLTSCGKSIPLAAMAAARLSYRWRHLSALKDAVRASSADDTLLCSNCSTLVFIEVMLARNRVVISSFSTLIPFRMVPPVDSSPPSAPTRVDAPPPTMAILATVVPPAAEALAICAWRSCSLSI